MQARVVHRNDCLGHSDFDDSALSIINVRTVQALSKLVTVAELLSECRRRANRDGVSLVILDEMQYIQKGLGAAKVTDILLNMAGIGPPMIYVCNYSLGHKLFERNNEDQHAC